VYGFFDFIPNQQVIQAAPKILVCAFGVKGFYHNVNAVLINKSKASVFFQIYPVDFYALCFQAFSKKIGNVRPGFYFV
jgi:hypothetical protein